MWRWRGGGRLAAAGRALHAGPAPPRETLPIALLPLARRGIEQLLGSRAAPASAADSADDKHKDSAAQLKEALAAMRRCLDARTGATRARADPLRTSGPARRHAVRVTSRGQTASATLGSLAGGAAESDLPCCRTAATRAPPTAVEQRAAEAQAALLQWLSYAASRAPSAVFAAYRDAIARALLPTAAGDPHCADGVFYFSTHPALDASLSRRAGRDFVGLLALHAQVLPSLTHHASRCEHDAQCTPTAREWAALCRLLTVERSQTATAVKTFSSTPLLRLPLLPSGTFDSVCERSSSKHGTTAHARGDAGNELCALAATLSFREALCVLAWGRAVQQRRASHAACRLSADDALFVLRRYAQAVALREGSGLPDDRRVLAELTALWRESRSAPRDGSAAGTETAAVVFTGRAVTVAREQTAATSPSVRAMPDVSLLSEWLLQGHWERVLRHALAYAHAHMREQDGVKGDEHGHCGPVQAAPDAGGERLSAGVHSDALNARLRRLLAPSRAESADKRPLHSPADPLGLLTRFFSRPSRTHAGDDWGRLSVALPPVLQRQVLARRLPDRYAKGPVTEDELRLLAHNSNSGPWGLCQCAAVSTLPLCRRLQRQHAPASPRSVQALGAAEEEKEAATDRLHHDRHTNCTSSPGAAEAALSAVRAALAAERARDVGRGRDPAAPPVSIVTLRRRLWTLAHLPPHLPRSLVRFDASHTRAGAVPLLLRSPQRELLPWVLAAFVGLAVEISSSSSGQLTETLAVLRAVVAPTLFAPCRDYAAFNDFVCEVFLHIGAVTSELAAEAVAPAGDAASRAGEVLFRCAIVLFRPPPPPSLPQRSSSSSSSLSPLARCVGERDWSLWNYYASLYLELVAPLAPSLAAYKEVVELLGERAERAVVLGPEAAASVATALVLRLLPTALSAPSLLADMARAVAAAPDGKLLFVVPADRAHPAASYFKALYHPSYVVESADDVSVAWDSPAALLAGRSLRPTQRYPTTTVDRFLELRPTTAPLTVQCLSHAPPAQRLRLASVDLVAAVEFLAQQHRPPCAPRMAVVAAPRDTRQPNVVTPHNGGDGGALPYGLYAVAKPAGVNATLHAGYPSLVLQLMRELPWQADSRPVHALPSSSALDVALAASRVPVTHQHGLVNRTDVGTSGLTLVARSPQALLDGRLHTLARGRVRKVYRALVQYHHDRAPVRSWQQWYLPAKGTIHSTVAADGTDADTAAAMILRPLTAVKDITESAGLPPRGPSAAADAHHEDIAGLDGGDDGRRWSGGGAAARAGLDQRPATTHYRVLEYFPGDKVYYLEVTLASGRRHQIRQHLAQLQHPLLGDTRYHPLYRSLHLSQQQQPSCETASGRPPVRAPPLRIGRPALHASALHITGPDAAASAVVECPVPADIQRVLRLLREREAQRQCRSPAVQ